MVRIYQAGDYQIGETITLSGAAAQHIGTVLRMTLGESLCLFCGDNREFLATISRIHKKNIEVYIEAVETVSRESPRGIHLAQAISKGERMEFVIQKAVELGVTSITPLLTERCVVRLDEARLAKKQAHWQAIAIAACEQSGRNQLPHIHETCSFDDYIATCNAITKWILHPHATMAWKGNTPLPGDIALLIGPEGGFSEAEVNIAGAAQFQALCLGPRILRTETAALAALSVIQAMAGDLLNDNGRVARK